MRSDKGLTSQWAFFPQCWLANLVSAHRARGLVLLTPVNKMKMAPFPVRVFANEVAGLLGVTALLRGAARCLVVIADTRVAPSHARHSTTHWVEQVTARRTVAASKKASVPFKPEQGIDPWTHGKNKNPRWLPGLFLCTSIEPSSRGQDSVEPYRSIGSVSMNIPETALRSINR